MSSIPIEAAKATYEGDTLEETVRKMAAAINCTKVYVYANDFGDKRMPTDFYRIERPGDEERLRSSPSVHNLRLVYLNGVFIHEAPTPALRWSPRNVWVSWSVWWRFRWNHDRLVLLAVVLLLLAWGCISLSFIREEIRLAAHFSLPRPQTTWPMIFPLMGTALGTLFFISLLTGPVAYFTWRKLLDERHGSGWLTYAALALGFGLFLLAIT